MYSRAYSDAPINEALNQNDAGQMVLPPRYSGVRFAKTKRIDGKDRIFERNLVPMARETQGRGQSPLSPPSSQVSPSVNENGVTGTVEAAEKDCREKLSQAQALLELRESSASKEQSGRENEGERSEGKREQREQREQRGALSELFSFFGEDDLLIITLIILLAGQNGENNRGVVLLLAMLLCFR